MPLSETPKKRSSTAWKPILTAHERLVLRALANGFQSKEIAREIRRSTPTVEAHVRSLFLKFDARSRAHLVARALLVGALEPESVEIIDYGP